MSTDVRFQHELNSESAHTLSFIVARHITVQAVGGKHLVGERKMYARLKVKEDED